MKDKRIAVIGCGNLGLAIVHGILEDGSVPANQIIATRRRINLISDLEKKGVQVTSDNKLAVEHSELILLAVKPYNVASVLEEINPVIQAGRHVVVSLATGVSILEIQKSLQAQVPVIRAMPNTAADVEESVTCICSSNASEQDLESVKFLFDLIGRTIIIDEALMESATILGACGIAYVLRFIRAMIQGGIQIGFDANTASAIVTQTVKGAAMLLLERGEHPEREIDKVTTPKGCTIVGLNEMEHNGFSSSLIRGIVSSYEEIAK